MHDMGDGMYVSSPDEIKGDETAIPNRLEDFYIHESKCEFDGCAWTAVHHCCDTSLYWQGCGRLFCEEHAKSAKDPEEGDAIALVCRDCQQHYTSWKSYSIGALFVILLTFGLLWKLSTLETLPSFLVIMKKA